MKKFIATIVTLMIALPTIALASGETGQQANPPPQSVTTNTDKGYIPPPEGSVQCGLPDSPC